MDLRDNSITIGELLRNDEARTILRREFPELNNPLLLGFARKMRLSEVLEMSKGRVAPEKVAAVLEELRQIAD